MSLPLDLLDKLRNLLDREESNVVEQQKAIELLVASHALRAGSIKNALFVAKSVHRHACQFIEMCDEADEVAK